jgi:polysaccharide biosynthesis/export protein
MRLSVLGCLAGLIVMIAGPAAVAAPGAPAPPAPSTAAEVHATPAAGAAYILGPGDVIEVSILGRSDYTTNGRIGEDGAFRLPFLGAVVAANRTSSQLGEYLASTLDAGGYFAHPIVKVEITSYACRCVTVLGEFVHPGLVSVDRAYRLSEIIARVGGVKESGAGYVIFRPKTGQQRRIDIAAMAHGDLIDDPNVSAGDIILSFEGDHFYIAGQIILPGAFPLHPGETFRQAISRAGGVTASGDPQAITVTRAGKKFTHVDLDSKVMPGDTILVRERLF